MALRLGKLGVLLVLASTAPRVSDATEPKALGVGLFSPDLGLSPYELFDQIDRIARHLANDLKLPVTAHAYKRIQDLGRDVRAGKIQLAVIGALQLASSSFANAELLAWANQGNDSFTSWTLLAKQKLPLAELHEAVLQLPELAEQIDAFIEHGLLGSNIRLAEQFKLVRSPDLYSTLQAIRVGAARVVFAPAASAGLTPLLAARLKMPCPLLVSLAAPLDRAFLERVRRAAVRFRGTGAITGFVALQDDRVLADTRALLRRRLLPLVPARPRPAAEVSPADFLEPYDVAYELPALPLQEFFLVGKAP